MKRKTLSARILRKLVQSFRRWQLIEALLQQTRDTCVDISDEYVNWLCYANAGIVDRGNLYCFDFAMRNLPTDAPILEIGSFCGLSTNLLTYYRQRHRRANLIITCDKWNFEGAKPAEMLGESSITHDEYREFVKSTFIRNIQMFSRYNLPHPLELTSDDCFAAWRRCDRMSDVLGRIIQLGGPISFCYIDGNHLYEYVRRDFENCHEFLQVGGFLLFDDSSNDSRFEGVRRVAKEVQDSGKYDFVAKNPNYLFRKR